MTLSPIEADRARPKRLIPITLRLRQVSLDLPGLAWLGCVLVAFRQLESHDGATLSRIYRRYQRLLVSAGVED